jgi:hypothetical protein
VLIRCLIVFTFLATIAAGRAVSQEPLDSWQKTIADATFRKHGVDQPKHSPAGFLGNPHYQCETIGLGGTVVRVGPHGFTAPAAPAVDRTGHLESRPYLSQQHWWDEEAHRHQPFEVIGGYGPEVAAAIRARNDAPQPRILLCSTETRGSEIRRAMRAGADAYLLKPFDKDKIAHRLQRFGFL